MLLHHRYYSVIPLAQPCRACGGRILAKDAAYDAASVAFHAQCYRAQPPRPDPFELERQRQARELAAAREADRQRIEQFWAALPDCPDPCPKCGERITNRDATTVRVGDRDVSYHAGCLRPTAA